MVDRNANRSSATQQAMSFLHCEECTTPFFPFYLLLFKEDSNIASCYKNPYKKTHGRHESQYKVNPINCVVFHQPNPTSTWNYIAA